MIPSNDDIKRQVIPRWRTIRATTDAGELAAIDRQAPTKLEVAISARLADEFRLRVREWREEKDVSAAEELLAAAAVSRTSGFEKDVYDAARLVLDDPHSLIGSKDIARSLAGIPRGHQDGPMPEETNKMRLEIARRKRLLRIYPRDALLLTETALLYTNLGLNGSARNLLRGAAALAPENRYVLRSLTRFWVHQAEPDRALHFLSKSAATRRDPWLLAAQMAAEDIAHKSPSNWREAKRILGADRFSDFELTELAAAFATLQLQSGSHRLARKMFRRSLNAPTENSVAQVQWASRRDPTINVSHELTAKASEARAWEELAAGSWRNAVDATKNWLDIEPFSVRPAVMGSFIAVAHLGDGKAGEEFARHGLIANKGSSVLHNNLAVSLAMQGRTSEARAELANVKTHADTPEEIVMLASKGLIEMRDGNLIGGAGLYQQAIDLAIKLRDAPLWCRASAHFAFESSRYDKKYLPDATKAIMELYDRQNDQTKFTLSDVPAILARAAKLQTAADILTAMEQFRGRLPSYPTTEND